MRSPSVLWREVSGGLILLSDTDDYTFVNGPPSVLWCCLERPQTLAELVQAVADAFGVDRWVAEEQLVPAVDELAARGLLQPAVDEH